MHRFEGTHLVIIGFFLVLIGMVVPWLMVLHIIQATFFLSFASYGASVAGLFLGIIGAAQKFRSNRRRADKDEIYKTDFFRHDKS